MSVVLASGCGSKDESSAAIWCDGVCTAVARCGFQEASCRTACVTQNPDLDSESVNGAAAEKPCLAQLSCQAIGGDQAAWDRERQACWDQAVMSIAVTDSARLFCSDQVLAWFECGYALSLDDCEHIYSRWSDAIVDRLAQCGAKESCDKVKSCQEDVFATL
jgi:hypothetical protein